MKRRKFWETKIDLNKDLARSHLFKVSFNTTKFRRTTTPTKYFETFLSISLVSFHLKSNRTRSLSLQTECTSYLTSYQRT